MNKKIIGIVCAIGAAVCYGTNPLARYLYAEGMNIPSVLFYRFGLAWIIVALVMLGRCALKKENLRVSRREFLTLSALGILFILSSTTLYTSFSLMPSGIASTILFTYPVMTAAIMTFFFRERITWTTVLSIALSLVGVALLSFNDEGGTFSLLGIVLVLISALTYALYIIVVDKSPAADAAAVAHGLVLGVVACRRARHHGPGHDGLRRQVPRLHPHGHPRSPRAHDRCPHRGLRLRRAFLTTAFAGYHPDTDGRNHGRPLQGPPLTRRPFFLSRTLLEALF